MVKNFWNILWKRTAKHKSKKNKKKKKEKNRIEKVIKKRSIIYMSKGKVIIIHLIAGLMKKT